MQNIIVEYKKIDYGKNDKRNGSAGHMTCATSTSGLFMKHPGRLGDSPVCGSGFYVDSFVGGASATGLGEDVMKGCVSYEIVRLMKEGMHPQQACEKAVHDFDLELKRRRGKAGDMSLIAMKNIFEEGELVADSVISKMETVVNRGIRGEVKELIDFYSLDAIIAVGYRVSSLKATRFRQWATKIQ